MNIRSVKVSLYDFIKATERLVTFIEQAFGARLGANFAGRLAYNRPVVMSVALCMPFSLLDNPPPDISRT